MPSPDKTRQDRELEEFRSLMEVPSTFEEGFNWTSLLGAVFIALLMVPGVIYMGLLAGEMNIGPAAQWVTVILFIEVARRAHKNLRRSEIFVLFFMAGAAMNMPFTGLLWNQFYARSDAAAAFGIARDLPVWFAPASESAYELRSFFHRDWLPVIGLVVFGSFFSQLSNLVLGYGLFRMASDVERLPFPLAPIGAQGILALAEDIEARDADTKETWRWRVFAIGGALGLSFGAVYLLLPTVTGALTGTPIQILPIPFVDWTDKTSRALPAVATGLSFDLGHLLTGMVLPFFAMVGSFIGLLVTVVLNPILHHVQVLDSWQAGDLTVTTLFKNNVDFYLSFGIGVSLAIAIAGFWQVFRALRRRKARAALRKVAPGETPPEPGAAVRRLLVRVVMAVGAMLLIILLVRRFEPWIGYVLVLAVSGVAMARAWRARRRDGEGPGIEHTVPKGRGDIPVYVILGCFVVVTLTYITMCGWLIGWHRGVMAVLFILGFIYTPLISYVTARLEGIAGQVVEIPMIREASLIFSGYQGVAVWFLPMPVANYGQMTVFYRQCELTGTRFPSIWKTQIVLYPIILVSSILFANFIWGLAEVPSAVYPFAQVMWELEANNRSIMYSATLGDYSLFEEAFNWGYLGLGTGFGLALFAAMSAVGAPVFLVYGVVRGLGQTMPHAIIPQFIGALIGRYYFQRRLGLKWRQYVPVVAAGFACGTGLITTIGVGITFLGKSVIQLPF